MQALGAVFPNSAMPETRKIIEEIAQIQPGQEDWLRLDELLGQLWASGEPQLGTEALFRVFERFPERDGYGVFWSIVHGLERLPNYEPALIDSLRRQPTEFNVLMVARILNAGICTVGDTEGLALLEEVVAHPKATGQARHNAGEYIKARHTNSPAKDATG